MPLVKLNSGVTRQYSDRDARLLVLVKKGVIVEDTPQEPPQTKAEQVEQAESKAPAKRSYQRKDIQAEGK